MEELSNLQTLIETGGGFALLAVLVFGFLKYFLDYLKKRDEEENEMRKEILKDAREERAEYNKIIHEEHELHSKDMVDIVSKLKE